MKKLIFVFAAMAISCCVFAQTDTTKTKMEKDKMMGNMDMSKKDGTMMMDGKMMMIKDGKMSALKKTMTMSNGTKCMVDGTCVKKDGTKMAMKEGDHMDMAGNMHPKMKSGAM